MTHKIYNENTHILDFTSTVLSCKKNDATGNYDIILDSTAFFPEEGGQGSDKGTLNGIPVIHVSIDKTDTITHTLAQPLTEGLSVIGHVDWAQRFDYMQQHTGEHILSGLVHKYFSYHNVGFHLGSDFTTLDFDGVLTWDEIQKMELLVNEVIYRNLPVNVRYPSKDVLEKLNYRSKIEIDGAVRIVEIPEIDLCACCAPHVDHTGQIGILKVVSMETHRGGVRITILCGNRAFTNYSSLQETVSSLSAFLSAKPESVCDAVNRLKEESQSRQERINILQAKLLEAHLKELPTFEVSKHAILFEESMDTKAVRNAVNCLSASYEGFSAVFTGDDTNGYQFIIGSSKTDCNQLAKLLREKYSAKCGGSAQMIQGSVAASKMELTTLLMQNNL